MSIYIACFYFLCEAWTGVSAAWTGGHTVPLCLSVVFPQDLLEKGLEASNFAMLGLGDIVIPGIFIALLLRFDVR